MNATMMIHACDLKVAKIRKNFSKLFEFYVILNLSDVINKTTKIQLHYQKL